MNQELEIEFKNLLTEEEYTTLYQTFYENEESFIQHNSYFDTNDLLLKKHKCALRIRTKEKSAELTLKTPFEGHHNEANIPLDLSEAHKMIENDEFVLPNDLNTLLQKEGVPDIKKVYKLADLTTERFEKKLDKGLLVLDKSWFGGQTDYELEVESSTIEMGESLFLSLLDTYSIPRRQTENKIARAFRAGKK